MRAAGHGAGNVRAAAPQVSKLQRASLKKPVKAARTAPGSEQRQNPAQLQLAGRGELQV